MDKCGCYCSTTQSLVKFWSYLMYVSFNNHFTSCCAKWCHVWETDTYRRSKAYKKFYKDWSRNERVAPVWKDIHYWDPQCIFTYIFLDITVSIFQNIHTYVNIWWESSAFSESLMGSKLLETMINYASHLIELANLNQRITKIACISNDWTKLDVFIWL